MSFVNHFVSLIDLQLLRLALQRDGPDVRVLEWLFKDAPPRNSKRLGKCMLYHTERGDLDVVQWLHTHRRNVSQAMVDEAAKRGHTNVLRYFYEHSERRCTSSAVECAAANGFVDVVKFVVENQTQRNRSTWSVWSSKRHRTHRVVDAAATVGQSHKVEYLNENSSGCNTARRMDLAAAHGLLDIVKFLYDTYGLTCSADDFDRAAENSLLVRKVATHARLGKLIAVKKLALEWNHNPDAGLAIRNGIREKTWRL